MSEQSSAVDDEHVFHDLNADHRMLLTPTEVYVKAAHLGTKKAQVLWWKTLILSILGGGYIALGGATCYLVAGTLNQAPGFPDSSQHNTGIYRLIFGAFGFPFAFTAIYTCGSELFTCQCLYTFVAWMEGQIPVTYVFQMLTLSWVGNCIGCVFIAWLFLIAESFKHHEETIVLAVDAKLNLSDEVVFVRAIFASWLITISVWTSNAALDFTGKSIAVFLPIFTFAAIGFEHAVANQYILTQGCILGADCSAASVVKNLCLATVGNWIGGVALCAAPYCLVYGRPDWILKKERFF